LLFTAGYFPGQTDHSIGRGGESGRPAIADAAVTVRGMLGTMTTAYFGIKSMSNTAKNVAGPPTGPVPPAIS